jgi:hypothetical protein
MITDDDLLLYHYQDGLTDAERARIANALKSDTALAGRLEKLSADMNGFSTTTDTPVPAAATHRWKTDLDRAARVQTNAPRKSWQWSGGLAAAGVTLGVVLLVSSIGVNVLPTGSGSNSASGTSTPPPTEVADDAARYERSLQWHLAQTESQLSTLKNADGEERGRVIDKVIVQNRLYAIAADRANEDRLARVLRSFTPLLEAIADRNTSPVEVAGGIAQLNFELKVMQARLATGTSTSSNIARQVLAL